MPSSPSSRRRGRRRATWAAEKVSITLVVVVEEEEEMRGVRRKRRLSVGNAMEREVEVRTTRSIGLAKPMVWSPVVERKRAKWCTEGVRWIAEVGGGVSLSGEDAPSEEDMKMIGESEGIKKDMTIVENKSSVDVHVTRSLRGKAVMVVEVEDMKKDVKMVEKGVLMGIIERIEACPSSHFNYFLHWTNFAFDDITNPSRPPLHSINTNSHTNRDSHNLIFRKPPNMLSIDDEIDEAKREIW